MPASKRVVSAAAAADPSAVQATCNDAAATPAAPMGNESNSALAPAPAPRWQLSRASQQRDPRPPPALLDLLLVSDAWIEQASHSDWAAPVRRLRDQLRAQEGVLLEWQMHTLAAGVEAAAAFPCPAPAAAADPDGAASPPLPPPPPLRWCAALHIQATFALMGLKPLHAKRCISALIAHLAKLKRRIHGAHAHEAPTLHASHSASSDADAALSLTDEYSHPPPGMILAPLSFGPTPLPAATSMVLTDAAFLAAVGVALQRGLQPAAPKAQAQTVATDAAASASTAVAAATALPPPSVSTAVSTAASTAAAAAAAAAAASNSYHHQLYAMCREVTEQRRSIVILLAGTSGTGKSTLASLLAERLRISCVVSTDSIRHTLREHYPRSTHPTLHVSTYQTDQLYGAAATQTQAQSQMQPCQPDSHTNEPAPGMPSHPSSSSLSSGGALSGGSCAASANGGPNDPCSAAATAGVSSLAPPCPDSSACWSSKKKVLHGYKSQSRLVLAHLTVLLRAHAAARRSVIVEGVHLLPSQIVEFMLTLPGAIPFLVFISNESKHRERFAFRGCARPGEGGGTTASGHAVPATTSPSTAAAECVAASAAHDAVTPRAPTQGDCVPSFPFETPSAPPTLPMPPMSSGVSISDSLCSFVDSASAPGDLSPVPPQSQAQPQAPPPSSSQSHSQPAAPLLAPSLDPRHNKYISSFPNIRTIQRYLLHKSSALLFPCIDNTNVDRSVAAIHSVIVRCMPHLSRGASLFSARDGRAALMHEELKREQTLAWSSKAMQRIIHEKVQKKELFRRLFAHKRQVEREGEAAEQQQRVQGHAAAAAAAASGAVAGTGPDQSGSSPAAFARLGSATTPPSSLVQMHGSNGGGHGNGNGGAHGGDGSGGPDNGSQVFSFASVPRRRDSFPFPFPSPSSMQMAATHSPRMDSPLGDCTPMGSTLPDEAATYLHVEAAGEADWAGGGGGGGRRGSVSAASVSLSRMSVSRAEGTGAGLGLGLGLGLGDERDHHTDPFASPQSQQQRAHSPAVLGRSSLTPRANTPAQGSAVASPAVAPTQAPDPSSGRPVPASLRLPVSSPSHAAGAHGSGGGGVGGGGLGNGGLGGLSLLHRPGAIRGRPVASEVDSEEETPLGSDGSDSETYGSRSARFGGMGGGGGGGGGGAAHGGGVSSRGPRSRLRHGGTHPDRLGLGLGSGSVGGLGVGLDTLSQVDPSLYSYDASQADGDAFGGLDSRCDSADDLHEDAEHEHADRYRYAGLAFDPAAADRDDHYADRDHDDVNMGAALQEEEEEDEDEDEDRHSHLHTPRDDDADAAALDGAFASPCPPQTQTQTQPVTL